MRASPGPPRRCSGRLRVPDRVALAGIVYVLRKGVAWRDVPASVVGCSGVTSGRRLREPTQASIWSQLHAALLTELRMAGLLDMDAAAIDGSHIRALKGVSVVAGRLWGMTLVTARDYVASRVLFGPTWE
ncbi:transposase [Streptomyces mirabilis]